MSRKDASDALKGKVVLTGLDRDGKSVVKKTMSVFEYYGALIPMLDDDCAYRARMGIRFVDGRIYNLDGHIDQEFRNSYDDQGNYIESDIRFPGQTASDSE